MALKQEFEDLAIEFFNDTDFEGIMFDATYRTSEQTQDPITLVISNTYYTFDIRVFIADALSFQKTIVKTLGGMGNLVLLPEATTSIYDYYISFPGKNFPYQVKAGDEILEDTKVYLIDSVITNDPASAMWTVRARRSA
jgi:hypothetical protein